MRIRKQKFKDVLSISLDKGQSVSGRGWTGIRECARRLKRVPIMSPPQGHYHSEAPLLNPINLAKAFLHYMSGSLRSRDKMGEDVFTTVSNGLLLCLYRYRRVVVETRAKDISLGRYRERGNERKERKYWKKTKRLDKAVEKRCWDWRAMSKSNQLAYK